GGRGGVLLLGPAVVVFGRAERGGRARGHWPARRRAAGDGRGDRTAGGGGAASARGAGTGADGAGRFRARRAAGDRADGRARPAVRGLGWRGLAAVRGLRRAQPRWPARGGRCPRGLGAVRVV